MLLALAAEGIRRGEYQMARYGAYEAGNVYAGTYSQNQMDVAPERWMRSAA